MDGVDSSLHIVHNLIVTSFDGGKQDQILTPSSEGISVLRRGSSGVWSKTLLGEGAPGEVKLGRIGGNRRARATVEPSARQCHRHLRTANESVRL
jgi:hypothetical protein